jgi:hypothetical protein
VLPMVMVAKYVTHIKAIQLNSTTTADCYSSA